jgi:uncharacterized membrane protein
VGAAAAYALAMARTRGVAAEALAARRRLQPLLLLEHASLLLLLVTGVLLMRQRGWGLGHARWLLAKLGLVAFLVVPLEGFHAWIAHVWIARGLRQTSAPPFSKDLARGVAVQEMIATLALPLLGATLPLLLWLSLARPF